ncbi:hypothetical protein ANME2D_02020 [Candidatus Methanoperedens nitroreducens]|uniref:GINS subunit domain-containing protein n=1 Tax=Candidatus Methanoperedens nitratireducens TaxID=1392998 RepID=A0A062V5X7_9EURY|nr:hypothetical protein [Candidatus Methanoperedens nitroreducens]KCZ71963.1 hypothetical protein ANME2D_02020 [Candidatus Methanoperedens nitroreducens]MDJ1422059.1 hypothetical protein [Candidatus Methanoperedens sp.]
MPDQSRINLDNILKIERDERKKLVPLQHDFYDRAAMLIRELGEAKKNMEDMDSTKYEIIEAEFKNAKNEIKNIIEQRIKKIVKKASLQASSKQREIQDLDLMTQEEREFYNKLLELMTEYRSELLDKIFIFNRKDKQSITYAQSAVLENSLMDQHNADPESDPQEETPSANKKKEISFEYKKDISKEYIVVRLLKDIPTFVGADGRNYTLAKEDVAILSALNAKALINRNAAIQISVKR